MLQHVLIATRTIRRGGCGVGQFSRASDPNPDATRHSADESEGRADCLYHAERPAKIPRFGYILNSECPCLALGLLGTALPDSSLSLHSSRSAPFLKTALSGLRWLQGDTLSKVSNPAIKRARHVRSRSAEGTNGRMVERHAFAGEKGQTTPSSRPGQSRGTRGRRPSVGPGGSAREDVVPRTASSAPSAELITTPRRGWNDRPRTI